MNHTITTQAETRPLPAPTILAPPPVAATPVARRAVLRWAFWGSIAAAVTGGAASLINALYPRTVEAFGGPVAVPAAAIPRPGTAPVPTADGHFLLVNLATDEGRLASDETPASGGLLALWWKCPHLGCTVPWKGDYRAGADKDPLDRKGWFNCNCHGSTYTKAGVRVFGPAPRSMDTMQIDVSKDGGITVQTGKRRSGDTDNPQRTVSWPPA
jgi:cytochrome b6-f complex iron-sulfur subunit